MDSTATPEQISLRVVVKKRKNRVLYAEAGKDFVDILLSFLTLPLGTIARLVSKDSNTKPCQFGCISSLYASVCNLDPKYLNSETCKQMLLQPRNPMERYNQKLKLNIDDTDPTKYYACDSCFYEDGSLVSSSENLKCECGGHSTFLLTPCKSLLCSGSDQNEIRDTRGYVKETAFFLIAEDLNIIPADLKTILCLLKNLHSKDPPQESTVVLGSNECLLMSKTALTDLLLGKEHSLVDSETSFETTDERRGRESTRTMKMKVLISKSKSKILFAQVEEDFVDQLLSFLTFPLGAVERVLEGNSGLVCVDKLYNSLNNFDSTGDFKSEKMKNMLADLKVAPYFKVNDQMLPIDELKCPSELSYCYSKLVRSYYLTSGKTLFSKPVARGLRMSDPKSPIMEEKSGNGYAKSRTKYMVADDLSVKPFSSHHVLSSLAKFKVHHHDLEERTICVGAQEVLSILKASLVSTSALRIGLNFFDKYY
ncbi:uncharacterized protein LOC114727933 isoform X2 [Neltuma alba]|uniref:uncharacterized protein LOC114727933 isoform X2 n=1 Tax=Neltuma alba TaxID=207710 RepID=UPI0010A46162|nr:uncharacterized protein LOC114727933 isoform X2 [Prosopis alba]